ncbi:hypothetical protein P280DRAFT_474624, partial [Massarina eburnea CBS 473.64]
MVTTRRGTGTDPSAASTPRSSTRKTRGKRELDAPGPEETPTTAKRRRRSGRLSGLKVDETPQTSQQEMGEEQQAVTPKATSKALAEPATEEPATTQGMQFYTPGTHVASSVYATPALIGEEDGSPTPESANNDTPVPKNTRIRFGSEEPATATKLTATPQTLEPAPNETADFDDDNASDSDEGPETVTIATAASKAKADEEGAVRAHAAQREKDLLKEQQRAERIAQEQMTKRKREETKAKDLAKRLAREERHAQKDVPVRAPLEIPALLPDSILADAGDRRPPTPPPTRSEKTAEKLRKEKVRRHIKFLEQSEKPVKDVNRGGINVSVLAKQNELLAPKVKKNTKNIREHWLKGRQLEKRGKAKGRFEKKKVERRQVRGGFLRDSD